MKNLISERVADFLKDFPPFNELHERDLNVLTEEVTILHREKGEKIFDAQEEAHPHFYVVHKGAIEVRDPETSEIVDICDEGDIFGLRALIAHENYLLQAKAFEESILYAIPITVFRPFTQSYEEVNLFLMESFASNTSRPYVQNVRPAQAISNGTSLGGMMDIQQLEVKKKPVCCPPGTSAKRIAEIMSSKRVGSVIITKDHRPIGIITDKDLRNHIVSGNYPVTIPAEVIMSKPVVTYPYKLTVAQAQMAMMKSDISHICLTEDGTTESQVRRVISKHDIMVSIGNNPAALIKAIKRSTKIKHLKSTRKSITRLLQGYLNNNLPLSMVLRIIGELNDAVTKQVVQISLDKMGGNAPVAFAWLSLGSMGRGEQLLITDQDNALIYQDSDSPEIRQFFLTLTRKVNKGLQRLGYEYCPAEMMASNEAWCRPLSGWKEEVGKWIHNPGKEEVLLSSIFFDYSVSYGDTTLVQELSQHIFKQTEGNEKFYMHLASGALQSPSPTGFFRSFLLEQDGAHKDHFDLKRRALMPLTDAARVLILSYNIKSINSTPARYEKLAELEENNRELFLSCSYATKALMKFRARQGLLNSDSGRFISLDSLSKEEKVKLKRTFKTIKEIQELISVRFKVTNYRP